MINAFLNTGKILCVDPGAEFSGVALLENGALKYSESQMNNYELIARLECLTGKGAVAMEELESYNLRVGQATFESVFWSGRFFEASAWPVGLYTRKEVKIFILGSVGVKSTDAAIRKAVLSLYPKTGGGKTPQIGTARKPGPLYGLTGHAVQALAVGIVMIGKRHYLSRLSEFKQLKI
ncbi:MAG: hypothetical protein GY710_02035 [Desulfobacteraceae bacterium]|nr:hypothetical protein [Desulfobacteraceae bacterium]